jgi:hypothetical protein
MRKLRPYNVKDVRTVVSILLGLTKSNLKNLFTTANNGGGNIPADDSTMTVEERIGEMIFDILSEVWDQAEEPLFAWFASLNEMTVEQFNNEPAETVIDTIEAIATREESRSFFSRVLSVAKTITRTETSTKKR